MTSKELLCYKTCVLFRPYYSLTSLKIPAHKVVIYPLQPTDLSDITNVIVEQAMKIGKEDAHWTLPGKNLNSDDFQSQALDQLQPLLWERRLTS